MALALCELNFTKLYWNALKHKSTHSEAALPFTEAVLASPEVLLPSLETALTSL